MKVITTMTFALAVLSGCATSPPAPTDPVARGDGTFKMTRIGAHMYAAPAEVTATATKDAESHCLKSGKKFKSIELKEFPSSMGHGPGSELLFRCD